MTAHVNVSIGVFCITCHWSDQKASWSYVGGETSARIRHLQIGLMQLSFVRSSRQAHRCKVTTCSELGREIGNRREETGSHQSSRQRPALAANQETNRVQDPSHCVQVTKGEFRVPAMSSTDVERR